MKKILWFDCETTGLNPVKNDIVQIAGIIEIDGEIKDEFNYTCQPFSFENIEQSALDVNKRTIEELKGFNHPKLVKDAFTTKIGLYCDKFDRNDKFYPAGYNCKFDIDFLAQWFNKSGDNYLGSWINWRALDPLPMLYIMDFKGEISLPNYKLETVANWYQMELKAHDAISDIKVSRAIFNKLMEKSDAAH